MSLVVLVSFIYIVFFSDDCKYFCIGTGIKYLFIYLFIYLLLFNGAFFIASKHDFGDQFFLLATV
jgi:hypothetical protein